MKFILTLILGFLQFTSVLGQNYCSVYQKSLDDFIQNEWKGDFFINECTKLKFDKSIQIEINVEEPLTDVDRFQVSVFLDTSLLRITNGKDVSNEEFEIAFNKDSVFEGKCLQLSKYSQFIKSLRSQPCKEKEGNYFLRMSKLFFWNGNVYLSFWVKKSKNTSGSHIIYKFDSNLNIVSKRVYNMCDEFQ